MKLLDLNPVWINIALVNGRPTYQPADSQITANALRFNCPLCLTENPEHQHSITVPDSTVPPTIPPGPGRWKFEGPTFDQITIFGANGRSDSVWLQGGCGAHFFVRSGEITFA